MIIGTVLGNVVSTHKTASLVGEKLLLVQPLDLEGKPRGEPILSIDGVDAGEGDRVLLVVEGRSASSVAGIGNAPVDAAIVGIVDTISLDPK